MESYFMYEGKKAKHFATSRWGLISQVTIYYVKNTKLFNKLYNIKRRGF